MRLMISKFRLLLALVSFLFVSANLTMPTTANQNTVAHIANGSELLTYCARISSAVAQVACLGYIAGISDAMIDERIIGNGAAIRACISKDVRAGDRAAKVIKWLANRTGRLSEPAAGLVASALSDAFPC